MAAKAFPEVMRDDEGGWKGKLKVKEGRKRKLIEKRNDQ